MHTSMASRNSELIIYTDFADLISFEKSNGRVTAHPLQILSNEIYILYTS